MVSLNALIKATHPSVPFLKSPDYIFANLAFKKTTSGAIDVLGNPTGFEIFSTVAHLYLTNSLEAQINPAQGQQSKIYKGHSINPLILPNWIVAGASGQCTIADRTYDFTLRSIDRTAMPAYSTNFGERLEVEIFTNSKAI